MKKKKDSICWALEDFEQRFGFNGGSIYIHQRIFYIRFFSLNHGGFLFCHLANSI